MISLRSAVNATQVQGAVMLVIKIAATGQRSSRPAKVGVKPSTGNMSQGCAACCITHILSDVFSHCAIVECWCKMMIEAISL